MDITQKLVDAEMEKPMRCRHFLIAGMYIGWIAVLLPQLGEQQLWAQSPAPVEETFPTADGVTLRGLFYRSERDPATAPVVILMYPPGQRGAETDMTKGDWEGLANRLVKAGYHVFRFDWRGHGKRGHEIRDREAFWGNPFTGPWNVRYVAGANKKLLKNDIYFKDILNPLQYMPVYLQDLAAVRAHLDAKNDAGECNTSSIYLIGSGSAVCIGMAWLMTEWNRPAFVPQPNELIYPAARYEFVPQNLNGGIKTAAGEDISAAVWLSPQRPSIFRESDVKNWIAATQGKMRNNNPMLFMYADKDTNAKREAEFFFKVALVGDGDKRQRLSPLNPKYLHPVTGAGNLSGVALLGNNANGRHDPRIPGGDPKGAGQNHPQKPRLHRTLVH